MHARIALSYDFEHQVRRLDDESRGRLIETAPWVTIPAPPEPLEKWRLPYDQREAIIDLTTTGAALSELDITFEIKRFTGCRKVATPEVPRGVVNLQVAIPNLLLFAVDEVMLCEDFCTDALQELLTEGWRILCVCPPANQRRPDYILGRQAVVDRPYGAARG